MSGTTRKLPMTRTKRISAILLEQIVGGRFRQEGRKEIDLLPGLEVRGFPKGTCEVACSDLPRCRDRWQALGAGQEAHRTRRIAGCERLRRFHGNVPGTVQVGVEFVTAVLALEDGPAATVSRFGVAALQAGLAGLARVHPYNGDASPCSLV